MDLTGRKIYTKFTNRVTVSNPANGNVWYQTDVASDSAINTSMTMGEQRGGVGNPIIVIIPSDSNATAEITTPDFNLRMRALQTGGDYGFGAPTRICADVPATGETLSVDLSKYGTPVAGLGYKDIFCYVQTIGEESSITTDGQTYPIDPATGEVSGFAAESGKTYKVWFWINKASTEYVTLRANFDPNVVHLEIEQPVYANEPGAADKTGTEIGTLITIVPYLKLAGNGGVTGSSSNLSTTSVSGTAIAFKDATVKAGCGSCNEASSALVHYLFVPCDDSGLYDGLYVLGGGITVETGESEKINVKLQMGGVASVDPDPEFMSYEVSGPSGTTVSDNGVVTAGSTAGSGTITATYDDGTNELSATIPLTVVSA